MSDRSQHDSCCTENRRLPRPPPPGPRALVRELGTLDATMIVMGAMIGSGIFITSAESARLVGSPGWLLVRLGRLPA